MARNRVVRELKHRRATQGRMCPLEEQDGLPDPDTSSLQESVGMDGGMGDRAERAVRTARFVLREEDEVTRMMVSARCASPPRTFSEISATTGVSSSALRMRMTRFTRRVRSVLPPDVDQGCPGNPFGKESCAPGGRTPDENLEVPSCSLKVR
jgi:DNA-directed RNA polymerase specialized sigma24 family protein